MERVREIIGKYLPFSWWVLMAILMVCGVDGKTMRCVDIVDGVPQWTVVNE